jgi:hypothetical protein
MTGGLYLIVTPAQQQSIEVWHAKTTGADFAAGAHHKEDGFSMTVTKISRTYSMHSFQSKCSFHFHSTAQPRMKAIELGC